MTHALRATWISDWYKNLHSVSKGEHVNTIRIYPSLKNAFHLSSEYGFLNNKTQMGLETEVYWDNR